MINLIEFNQTNGAQVPQVVAEPVRRRNQLGLNPDVSIPEVSPFEYLFCLVSNVDDGVVHYHAIDQTLLREVSTTRCRKTAVAFAKLYRDWVAPPLLRHRARLTVTRQLTYQSLNRTDLFLTFLPKFGFLVGCLRRHQSTNAVVKFAAGNDRQSVLLDGWAVDACRCLLLFCTPAIDCFVRGHGLVAGRDCKCLQPN